MVAYPGLVPKDKWNNIKESPEKHPRTVGWGPNPTHTPQVILITCLSSINQIINQKCPKNGDGRKQYGLFHFFETVNNERHTGQGDSLEGGAHFLHVGDPGSIPNTR